MPDGLPIPEVVDSPRGSLQNECRKGDVIVLYKSNCCVFLLPGHAERMQKEGRVSVMNLKSKRYSYSAFVQAAFAQFLGYSKGQKPSGFLRACSKSPLPCRAKPAAGEGRGGGERCSLQIEIYIFQLITCPHPSPLPQGEGAYRLFSRFSVLYINIRKNAILQDFEQVLRKLQDLHPEFVPQSVRQMVTSMIGLWSAKSGPRATTRFVAPTGSTKLEGGL